MFIIVNNANNDRTTNLQENNYDYPTQMSIMTSHEWEYV